MVEQPRATESQKLPEFSTTHGPLVALQSRLVQGGEALKSSNTALPDLKPDELVEILHKNQEKTLGKIAVAITKKQHEVWKDDMRKHDEQVEAWSTKIAEVFGNEKYRSHRDTLQKIHFGGLDYSVFTQETAKQLYRKYVDGGGVSGNQTQVLIFENGQYLPANLTPFVNDVFLAHQNTQNKTIDFASLEQNLDAIITIAKIYGEPNAMIIENFIKGSIAVFKSKESCEEFAKLANEKAGVEQEDGQKKETSRQNWLNPEEKELLELLEDTDTVQTTVIAKPKPPAPTVPSTPPTAKPPTKATPSPSAQPLTPSPVSSVPETKPSRAPLPTRQIIFNEYPSKDNPLQIVIDSDGKVDIGKYTFNEKGNQTGHRESGGSNLDRTIEHLEDVKRLRAEGSTDIATRYFLINDEIDQILTQLRAHRLTLTAPKPLDQPEKKGSTEPNAEEVKKKVAEIVAYSAKKAREETPLPPLSGNDWEVLLYFDLDSEVEKLMQLKKDSVSSKTDGARLVGYQELYKGGASFDSFEKNRLSKELLSLWIKQEATNLVHSYNYYQGDRETKDWAKQLPGVIWNTSLSHNLNNFRLLEEVRTNPKTKPYVDELVRQFSEAYQKISKKETEPAEPKPTIKIPTSVGPKQEDQLLEYDPKAARHVTNVMVITKALIDVMEKQLGYDFSHIMSPVISPKYMTESSRPDNLTKDSTGEYPPIWLEGKVQVTRPDGQLEFRRQAINNLSELTEWINFLKQQGIQIAKDHNLSFVMLKEDSIAHITPSALQKDPSILQQIALGLLRYVDPLKLPDLTVKQVSFSI